MVLQESYVLNKFGKIRIIAYYTLISLKTGIHQILIS